MTTTEEGRGGGERDEEVDDSDEAEVDDSFPAAPAVGLMTVSEGGGVG